MRWLAAAGVAALAASALVGCSGGSGDDAGTGATTTTVAVASDPTPTEAGFEVPAGRLDEVEAAGLTFVEVDYPSQPDGVPWPTEEWATGDLPDDVDPAEVRGIVDRAFGELSTGGDRIDAILVVDGGELVVEEYNGWDPAEPHPSWSMAKSITSALIGILVGEGRLDVTEPVDAPEWSEPGDPRAEITLDELLRMSSGLEWGEDYGDPDGDVLQTLGQDADRAGYAADKPLAHEPGTVWAYSTGTANLIARSVAEQVGYGQDLVDWIDRELARPLGIGEIDHSLDETGLISGGSFIDMAPRDFARFGLLYARGGIWDGERILPEGWVDYSRMPTPSGDGEYGAQWWLEPDRPTMFWASGFNGQSINVFPEDDLVIVVLSESPTNRDEQVRAELFDAFGV
ncbi:MAG: serine hydrolase [Acidimicrobiales bacterium]|nr:serine hydrolase [Acidimicrobiales bacterium]